MKSWLVYFLALFFAVTVPVVADEYRPERPAKGSNYRTYKKGSKKKRKGKRRRVTRRRISARRTAAKRRLARATRTAPKKKLRKRPDVAASSKPVTPKPIAAKPATPKPVTAKPVAVTTPKPEVPKTPVKGTVAAKPRPVDSRIPASWRVGVRRSIAVSESGRVVPVENFQSLGALMNTLPDDGEIRVRYGIYAGSRTYGPDERIAPERRNVRVPCWIYAVRRDTSDPNERDLQILVGTSNDTSRARYMIAEIPEWIPNSPDERLFEQARGELLALLPSYTVTPNFRRIAPKRVMIEGALYFDGLRTLARVDDPSGEILSPSTVWEIHPVTSISGLAE